MQYIYFDIFLCELNNQHWSMIKYFVCFFIILKKTILN